MRGLAFSLAFCLLSSAAGAVNRPEDEARWGAVAMPSAGPARVVGTYSNGCVAGAVQLPVRGAGYRAVKPVQNRHWGHPGLVAAIEDLGRFTESAGLGVMLVEDLGHPRGGPISGHASHESGLDADIRFQVWTEGEVPAEVIAEPSDEPFTNARNTDVDPARWTPAQAALVRRAAQDARVERIFVHPAVKKSLCADPGSTPEWQSKVRAWYGHRAHFHIRLGCPADSPDCIAQVPPDGDGCGEQLAWWFTDEPYAPADPDAPKPVPPPLPAACEAVIAE